MALFDQEDNLRVPRGFDVQRPWSSMRRSVRPCQPPAASRLLSTQQLDLYTDRVCLFALCTLFPNIALWNIICSRVIMIFSHSYKCSLSVLYFFWFFKDATIDYFTYISMDRTYAILIKFKKIIIDNVLLFCSWIYFILIPRGFTFGIWM